MDREHFWFEEPGDIVRRLNLLGHKNDSLDQKLNALTRLLIVLVIILALLKWRHWEWLLLGGIAFILFFHLSREKECLIENFNEDMSSATSKYYQQVPLEKLYTVQCGNPIPIEDQKTVVQSAPQTEPQIQVQQAHKKNRGGWSSPNPKPISASENEQRSYDFLREKMRKTEVLDRKNAMKSLF